MKIEFHEYDYGFDIEITAETVAEAALLVRFGMNSTQELKYATASASKSGSIQASIGIGKAKRPVSNVGRGKW